MVETATLRLKLIVIMHNNYSAYIDIYEPHCERNLFFFLYTSRFMRKLAFCICENKDADQLRGNPEADQRLCFHYTDSIIPLLSKSEISSFEPSSVAVQPS